MLFLHKITAIANTIAPKEMRGYILRLGIINLLAILASGYGTQLGEIVRIPNKTFNAGGPQNSIQNEEEKCLTNVLNSTLASLHRKCFRNTNKVS